MPGFKLAGFSLLWAIACLATIPTPAAADLKIEQALLAKLEQPARNFVFFEAPLNEVIHRIQEDHEIPLVIDALALTDAVIATDTLVTKSLKDLTLRSALNRMLADHGLVWAIADECVLITTEPKATRYMLRRTYPVRDLVEATSGAEAQGFQELAELLKSTIAPESWKPESVPPDQEPTRRPGTVAISRGAAALVVLQTPQVHYEIEALLASLRQARAEQGLDKATDVIDKALPSAAPPSRR